jgi:hypothetical protein
VRKHTKASASCGSCTGLVEQLLMFIAGGDYSATPKTKAMCGCTEHGHQAVREAIVANKLLSIDSVYKFLEWKTPNGCASCRPAINYYLISSWPKLAKDDPQSRFINERSHANIQKDGTYSVIPRMWGGETTAAELRRIADAVDKYKRIKSLPCSTAARTRAAHCRKALCLAPAWPARCTTGPSAWTVAVRTRRTWVVCRGLASWWRVMRCIWIWRSWRRLLWVKQHDRGRVAQAAVALSCAAGPRPSASAFTPLR